MDIEEHETLSDLNVYFHNILNGIGIESPVTKRKICFKYVEKNDLDKLQGIAWSFSWNNHPHVDEDDKPIIDFLIKAGDDLIDYYLVDGLKNYEKIDDNWVIAHLRTITSRCSERTYSELLMWLSPKNGKDSYGIGYNNIEAFTHLVFNTYRLNNINEIDYHLASCLEHIVKIKGIRYIYEYFKLRIEEKSKVKRYDYELISHYHTSYIGFFKEYEGHSILVESFLQLALENLEIKGEIIELTGKLINDCQSKELFKTLSKWIEDEDAKLEVVIQLLESLPKTKFWFDIVELIVIKTCDTQTWRQLYRNLGDRTMSGPFSSYYQSKVDMIKERKKEYTSIEMLNFLNYAEKLFSDCVKREKERETQEEDDDIV